MTRTIVLSVVAGVVLGSILNALLSAAQVAALLPYLHLVPQVFLRLIKCVVAPLVLTMLVVGIADHGDSREVGRVGAKAMLLFLGWSLLALLIGMVGADSMQPGMGSNLAPPSSSSGAAVQVEPFSIRHLMEELVPESLGEAWTNNAVLQIVLAGILTGLALSVCVAHGREETRKAREAVERASGEAEKAKATRTWRHVRQELTAARVFLHMMKAGKTVTFRVVTFVMMLAPAAAFFSLTAVVTDSGPGVLATYGRFAAEFCLSLLVLWAVFYAVGWIVARHRMPALLQVVKEPAVLAFSTASSEAALPRLLENLDDYGVPQEISGLVLPLGYSFNLDGSMMYCSFAVLFIAQVYGLHLAVADQIVMLLTLMVTSKGMAAVPKAALVVITSTLTQFHIPEGGVALILAVDQLLDMCRTATNVMGNTLTCVIVSVWEKASPSPAPVPVEVEVPGMTPIALAVAPNGARKTKADHPVLPLTADEIAEQARQCVEAGATLLHLHVRDADARHSLDPSHYRDATAAVRRAVGQRVIVQATTEAVGRYTPAEQMALMRALQPEAVSIAIRELRPETDTAVADFYRHLVDTGVGVHHILYSPEEARAFRQLVERGIISDLRPHALFVLGRYQEAQQSSPQELLPFLDGWPAEWPWSLCAFGSQETRCMAAACALGGHARVGFENNTVRGDGSTAGSNADLIGDLAELARRMGRRVATVQEARAIYGLRG